MRHTTKLFVHAVALTTVMACSPSGEQKEMAKTYFAAKPANVRINLTDAPNENLTSVFINIKHVELWLEKGGVNRTLKVSQGHGVVDLLTLQNGVLLPMHDINMPGGITVKHIRLVLEEDGHSALKNSGATCELRTPSAQQTGIKIQLSQPITFENDHSYSLVLDFDAKKSIVQLGNGDCLLKPVLKLKSATRLPSEDVGDDGSSSGPGEDLVDGGDQNSGDGDGFDNYDPNDPGTFPPDDITEEDLLFM